MSFWDPGQNDKSIVKYFYLVGNYFASETIYIFVHYHLIILFIKMYLIHLEILMKMKVLKEAIYERETWHLPNHLMKNRKVYLIWRLIIYTIVIS